MAKNLTITIDEEDLLWARHAAADRGTSVSKFVGELIGEQRRRDADYWAAFERWKRRKPVPGVDASQRLSREEVHERR